MFFSVDRLNSPAMARGRKGLREGHARPTGNFAAVQAEDTTDEPSAIQTVGEWRSKNPRIRCRHVSAFYAHKQVLQDVNLEVGHNEVIALMGPSGGGKSTFLRCLNRMNDRVEGYRLSGRIELDGQDIYRKDVDGVELRTKVGMVFQKPNPFPTSILENIAYGLRIHGLANCKEELWDMIEKALRRVGLWKEVKDRLDLPGTNLSLGQQQRLCIARTIAVNPEVILMDEPCSALDPIATTKVEQLIDALRADYSVVLVTHCKEQAARISQRTAFFHRGHLVEVAETSRMFTHPRHELTEAYISGRFD